MRHGENGFVTAPDPDALAAVLDRLRDESGLAEKLGRAGRDTLEALGIDWDNVIARLLQ
jgi:glycosyltransferase involved in cell wall biosynthesis